jgi:hydrogenase expression/formation protein HypD
VKYIDEYRDQNRVQTLLHAIHEKVTRPWTIMELCGGQTHAIIKHGIDKLLPDTVELVHGPGCPVCVTPTELIDKAIELSLRPEVILCSFGDMSRVPGTDKDLLSAKAHGADVRLVYSPLDAVELAQKNPDREVVFFAVGFETTAPATAMAVHQAYTRGLNNFSLLVAHVRVPPAMQSILSSPACRIQGFLAAGHVCSVMGTREYDPIASKYQVPIVVTGFEPLDIVHGVLMVVTQLEEQRYDVENQYDRIVTTSGNTTAQALLNEVFTIVPRTWRGIGQIDNSGLGMQDKYARHDAQKRFKLTHSNESTDNGCISGQVLQGLSRPVECKHFGRRCTPEHPLGAPMVSSEGACAAYYLHRHRSVNRINETIA